MTAADDSLFIRNKGKGIIQYNKHYKVLVNVSCSDMQAYGTACMLLSKLEPWNDLEFQPLWKDIRTFRARYVLAA